MRTISSTRAARPIEGSNHQSLPEKRSRNIPSNFLEWVEERTAARELRPSRRSSRAAVRSSTHSRKLDGMFRDLFSGSDWWLLPSIGLAALVLLIVLIDVSRVVRYIPNARLGVVEKLWSSSGSVRSGLLALAGEAGFEPDLLRGGFHFFPPFQYRVHLCPMVSVT